jgi:hypothetical protein
MRETGVRIGTGRTDEIIGLKTALCSYIVPYTDATEMEVAGAMGYFSMLSISWFFAACSLIGFGWYVLLVMQKGKKRHSTKMETEQMMAHLLAEVRSGKEHMKEMMDANQAKADANLKEMLARMDANRKDDQEEMKDLLARLECKIKANQAKTDVKQKEMREVIHSIRSELEETIQHRMEDALLCVDQKTQGLRKELTEKIDGHKWTYRQ